VCIVSIEMIAYNQVTVGCVAFPLILAFALVLEGAVADFRNV
jgi:hypothetical protein